MTNEPKELALRFGKAVGVETQDTAELMSKLKEIETEKLVLANEALTKEDVRTLKLITVCGIDIQFYFSIKNLF